MRHTDDISTRYRPVEYVGGPRCGLVEMWPVVMGRLDWADPQAIEVALPSAEVLSRWYRRTHQRCDRRPSAPRVGIYHLRRGPDGIVALWQGEG